VNSPRDTMQQFPPFHTIFYFLFKSQVLAGHYARWSYYILFYPRAYFIQ
jgi:hypothetical protein